MIGVTQRRTGASRGQCTEAAIATLLGVELDDVPDLWVLSGCPEGGVDVDRSRELEALYAWIKSWGLILAWGEFPPMDLPMDPGVFGSSGEVLPWDEPHLLGGDNPDGLPHMVVGQAGRVVWDPNPSRRGIVSVDAAGFLLPIDMIPEDLQHLPAVGLDFVSWLSR